MITMIIHWVHEHLLPPARILRRRISRVARLLAYAFASTAPYRYLWSIYIIGCPASSYGGESAARAKVGGADAGPLANSPRAIRIITKGGWKYSCVRALVRLSSR
jgi:hypothetical protein